MKNHIGPFERFILIEAARIVDEALGDVDGTVPAQLKSLADQIEIPADFDGRLRRYSDLRDFKDALNEELKSVVQQIVALEGVLVDEFEAEKTQAINRDGRTFYLSRSLLPSIVAGQQDAIKAAMQARGLDSMLSVNASTFASWMRSVILEQLENEAAAASQFSEGQPLPEPKSREEMLAGAVPPDFAGLVRVYEKKSLNVRSS